MTGGRGRGRVLLASLITPLQPVRTPSHRDGGRGTGSGWQRSGPRRDGVGTGSGRGTGSAMKKEL